MYPAKIIRVAKRLSAIASKEFPNLAECDFRIAIAAALFQVTAEDRILETLFDDDQGADLA